MLRRWTGRPHFTLILLPVTKWNIVSGLRLGQEMELTASGDILLRFQPQIICKQPEIFLFFLFSFGRYSPEELLQFISISFECEGSIVCIKTAEDTEGEYLIRDYHLRRNSQHVLIKDSQLSH